MVELKQTYDDLECIGQAEKANIVVGDKVAVSICVHANNKGIVTGGGALPALKYDFHTANIICSSTLQCNISVEVSGSVFVGDDDGVGKIFVFVRDAIVDP
jgi:hypothetical protein